MNLKHNLIFLAFVFIAVSTTSFAAKNNFPLTITLSNQAAIDDFATTYPGLTNIEGDLKIGDFRSGCTESDINNLSGLLQLTGIGGTLHIHKTILTDLTGLNNLQYVNGTITMSTNGSLVSMNGLNNINFVGGIIIGYDNYALSNCDALLNLTTINGSVAIYSDAFTTLNGLSNINTIQGDFSLGCDGLVDLTGLSNLTSIAGNFKLDENYSLVNVDQLSNLVSINGYLFINDNHSLENLNGLSNLTSINGCIYLNQNNKLTDIQGIANINPETINYVFDENFSGQDIMITNNPLLADCNVLSICTALGFPETTYTIEGNATGCYQSILNCLPVICTGLSSPNDQEQNVFVDANINWANSPNASGYRISIGTTPGGTEILNNYNVGSITSYDPVNNFPCGVQIYVRILPYRYDLTATGCVEQSFLTEKVIANTILAPEICKGNSTILSASGGNIYQWFPATGLNDPNIQNPVANPVSTTAYTVTVSNIRGCSDTSQTLVMVNVPPTSAITAIHESGNNFNDGMASVNPSGGKNPIQYIWNNGKTTKTIVNLIPGTYKITLTDANSCTTTDSVIINKFICPVISFNTQVEENTCFNTCDGYIAVKNISNAVAPLIFNWNTGMSSDSIGSLCSGNYSVTITDIKNCSTVDSFYIAQPDSLTIIVDSLQNYSQNSKGFINIHNSTDDKFSFSWTGPDGFVSAESDIYNLLPGCYHLILTDTLTGCESDTTICISNLTSSLNLSDANDINIFPNPASGSVLIDFQDCSSIIKEILILDNSGKKLKSEIVSKKGSVHLLDLTSLNPGMHFVKILFQNEAKYYKLIVL